MEDSCCYRLNTPQMHANLHTEFIHSVSFLISEDLNAHILSGATRNQLWHARIRTKVNKAQIARLKLFTAAGFDCNFKSWLLLSKEKQPSNVCCGSHSHCLMNVVNGHHDDCHNVVEETTTNVTGHQNLASFNPCTQSLFVSSVCVSRDLQRVLIKNPTF